MFNLFLELVPGETVEFECEGFGGFPSPNIHFVQPIKFQVEIYV